MNPSSPELVTLTFEPHGEPTQLTHDELDSYTVRDLAKQLGVNVFDRCGGNGVCCSCVVTVLQGAEHLTEKSCLEEAVTYLAAGDRLSCQCRLTGTGNVVLSTNPG